MMHSFVDRFLTHATRYRCEEPDYGDENWSMHMRKVLHEVKKDLNPWCACSKHDIEKDDVGEKHEWLWDMTWYERYGTDWDLPLVAIEHENSHQHSEFFTDFWKLMTAFVPLRVMIGYTSKDEFVNRIMHLNELVMAGNWLFPSHSKDLILIRKYADEGADPWHIYTRSHGASSFIEYSEPPSLSSRPRKLR